VQRPGKVEPEHWIALVNGVVVPGRDGVIQKSIGDLDRPAAERELVVSKIAVHEGRKGVERVSGIAPEVASLRSATDGVDVSSTVTVTG
jgi:hypothetical protein